MTDNKKHDKPQEKEESLDDQSVYKQKIERLQEKLEETENKYKRALADYQNLEKRTHEARSEWIKGANKELVLRLLPVLDTLMLAQHHVKDQGIALSIQQFLGILKQEGIEKIETLEKKFDPVLMECIETIEGPSAGSGQEAEEKVIEEVRAGYKLFDKVIRPAQVKVGKKI